MLSNPPSSHVGLGVWPLGGPSPTLIVSGDSQTCNPQPRPRKMLVLGKGMTRGPTFHFYSLSAPLYHRHSVRFVKNADRFKHTQLTGAFFRPTTSSHSFHEPSCQLKIGGTFTMYYIGAESGTQSGSTEGPASLLTPPQPLRHFGAGTRSPPSHHGPRPTPTPAGSSHAASLTA